MHPLVVFDIDGTLTRERSVWQYLMEQTGCWAGKGEENLNQYRRGEVNYYEFCRLDAQLLKGKSYEALRKMAEGVPKYDGLDAVFAYFIRREFKIALISTGLRMVADYFTTRYPIDFCAINDLEHEGDITTGKALIRLTDHEKAIAAREVIERFHTDYLVAFGDSRGDVPIFKMANFSVAVNAKDAELLRLASYQYFGTDLSECLGKIPV